VVYIGAKDTTGRALGQVAMRCTGEDKLLELGNLRRVEEGRHDGFSGGSPELPGQTVSYVFLDFRQKLS
jgi:hypothetical protein